MIPFNFMHFLHIFNFDIVKILSMPMNILEEVIFYAFQNVGVIMTGPAEYLVLQGFNIFKHGSLKFKWRYNNELTDVVQEHRDMLKSLNASELLEEEVNDTDHEIAILLIGLLAKILKCLESNAKHKTSSLSPSLYLSVRSTMTIWSIMLVMTYEFTTTRVPTCHLSHHGNTKEIYFG